jgi:single-strand DNA-binding protein
MNVIILTGNATDNVSIRITPNGKSVANGTIAVRRDRKNHNGEYETDFHNFVALGGLAEVMANHIKKGDKFGIKGTLQNRVWEKENGEKKYFTEVLVDGFDFPNRNTSQSGNNSSNETRRTSNPDLGGESFDISSDDLPF